MHLLPNVAIQPNLELKTRPKQLLGSLPVVIALPGDIDLKNCSQPLPTPHIRGAKYQMGVNLSAVWAEFSTLN